MRQTNTRRRNYRKTGLSTFSIVMTLLLCVSMVAGTTLAYFTDYISVGNNVIQSGRLDAKLYTSADPKDENNWVNAEDKTLASNALFNYEYWEPGYTDLKFVKVENAGNLAFQYELNIIPKAEDGSALPTLDQKDLMNVIDVYTFEIEDTSKYELPTTFAELQADYQLRGSMAELAYNPGRIGNYLLADESDVLGIALHMRETAGNEFQGMSAGDGFDVQLLATQYTHEEDSFGSDYDAGAAEEHLHLSAYASVSIAGLVDANGILTQEITLANSDNGISAVVPAGTKIADGVDTLTLVVRPLSKSNSDVKPGENETMFSIDVHVDGLAADNTMPALITIPEALSAGLNIGNYSLYHVEDGKANEMTLVPTSEDPDAHNEFSYDPATGDVTMALATFSEVAMTENTVNAWNGNIVSAFNGGDGTKDNPYIIANADQLAYMNACVSNDNANYGDKYYKLIADVNIGGEDNASYIFYPIGYLKNGEGANKAGENTWYTYGGAFSGTFDGAGHTISGIYQNTWAMDGDYDNGYYNDAMGLFGYIRGGTVKNLTIDNFYSEGEFAPTGCVAAYADGESTFENIAIINSHPQTYNTGVAGIVGWDNGGDTEDEASNFTFKNITIDRSNTISALWGSWDVAAAGLLGYLGEYSKANLDNCHVSATIDVYNDVCGNYQYYWYRYCGMLIGTVDKTKSDGSLDLSNITAENCSVEFGDRHEYYYCEFVENSKASYTHDYQFSRVDNKDIVGSGDTATCQNHNHAEHGYETVNGSSVLVEDKQAVYLPFYQLFGGYGWGVDGVDLGEKDKELANNIKVDVIQKSDIEESEEKFTSIITDGTPFTTGATVTIGELFAAAEITNEKLAIKSDKVQVFVSPVGDDSTAGGTYAPSSTDQWQDGTLTFSGTGAAKITITDYYFCTPTTIEVTITERTNAVKFETKFTGDFLYRVGNQNPVALGSLFEETGSFEIGTVDVTVDNVAGNASGTYTPKSPWTDGTIQFSGTGVVKVTITDKDYCIPTELYLEVVDAQNITSATGTTSGGTFVLLQDVNTSTYVNYWNCTLYGNGFTYSLNGAPTAYNSKQGHGILITKNATLDNLVIVGDVYNSYGAYTTQDYYNAAVDVVGDTTIQNCYISGCAAPVSTRANATITNTTLYGGTVANLIIKGGTVTLEDVTTANYDDGRKLVGMGIVIHSDATESAKLVLNGTLTQYNFISESKVPSDTYAKNLHTTMFDDSCSKFHFGTSPNRYVNTGIISLTALFNAEDFTDNANTGYVGTAVTVSGVTGYVYTQPNTSGSVNNNAPKYKPTTQGTVAPSYNFDYTNKNYVAKTDGNNDYCYEENGTVNISMDAGDTFNWDTSILTLGKGLTDYAVSMNGTDYTGKSIAFNTAGDYEVTYTYADSNNYKLDENGDITTYSVTYTKTVNITVAVVEAATKHAEFTFGSSNMASKTVTIGNNTYVMPNVSTTSSTIGSTTVSGQTIYYPIVEIVMSDSSTTHGSGWYAYFPVFSGAVTITDYKDKGLGDAETFGSNTQSMPSGLSIVGDPGTLFKYESSTAAGSEPVVRNEILVYSSAKIEADRNEHNTLVQYSFTDNAGATYYYYIGYHAPAQTYSCVTADTLITLADGTQKLVSELTVGDMVLVFNHITGAYEAAPLIFNTHADEVEEAEYDILHLEFADGREVKVVESHGFFDMTLMQYVYIDYENYQDYIGHSFYSLNHDGTAGEQVQLVNGFIEKEVTRIFCPVTYFHMNSFANGFLNTPNIPGGITGLVNYFDYDADLKYNEEAMQRDIETYGTYSYEDFKDYISEAAYLSSPSVHLKVAVGKGMITFEEILAVIEYLLAGSLIQ